MGHFGDPFFFSCFDCRSDWRTGATDARQASLKLQLMLAAAMRRRCFLSAAE
jgi:hypothetical protein